MSGKTDKHRHFSAHSLSDEHDILEAKRLHASVYSRIGFIDSWEVTEDGIIHEDSDPHQRHARYFAIKHKSEKRVVVTARQIYSDENRGFEAFPIWTQSKLSPEGRAKIQQYNPLKCVEISGLVKKSGTSPYAVLLLYRLMWQHSYRNNDELWLMACDVALYRRLKLLFGDAIERVGENTSYKGGDVVPAIVDVQRSVDIVTAAVKRLHPLQRGLNKNILRFFMSGL